MITFDAVRKVFPDGTTAVESLDLEVAEGEVAVLVGPSGCGKTTTLRMINRMVEPSDGRLCVAGRDVMTVDPPELRRGIGYVIQQIGLFPHRTIAQNIATVPGLVGWDRGRIAERVTELMATVGLDETVADRYPHQLSGGQRQRVGVARALAVDPPIMLMDEPFGAVDPIVRTKLQDEFLRLQSVVRKTIAFVTHDVDEAIKMGDRIAIFSEGGHLEQYDTPASILAEPANAFVESFLGGERGLKRLALIPASSVQAQPGPVVGARDSLAEAAATAERCESEWVVVVDDDGRVAGWVWAQALEGEGTVGELEPRAFRVLVRAEDSLRAALNAMVISRTGVAVRVSGDRHYEGVLTREILTGELQR